MPYLLGIDIGTSNTKALLCDDRGRVRGIATSPHTLESPRPGWSEQDPDQWWAAVCKATRAVIRKTKITADRVACVGLSGQMHGSVFIGRSGRPLRSAILWNDQRTQKECDAIEKTSGGRRRLISMVGNPALTGFTAPKILWVRKHQPRLFKRTVRVLLPKDYIRLRMTGVHATEVSDASGTLLFDVRRRRWNSKLMKLLKLDHSLMPSCYESDEVTGEITSEAAKALGLKAGTPVAGGGGDQAMGAVGSGIVSSGSVGATLGTSGVVYAHTDEPVYDKVGRVHTMCSAVNGRWCVFGCMLSAAGCLHWYRDKMRTGVGFDKLLAEASKAPAGCEGLFFLPYLTGERCPHPDPHARGGWVGLTRRHDQRMITRSLIEGVTFGMADQVRIFSEMGIPIRKIYLTGGGSKSQFWRQLQADIYGKKVVMTKSEEGAAMGAALIAGVGAGVWKSALAACKSAIHEAETRRPDVKLKRLYQKIHTQYQQLYPALSSHFAEVGAI